MSVAIVAQLMLVGDDVAAVTPVLPAPAIYVERVVYVLFVVCLTGFVVVDGAAVVVALLH